MAAQPKQYDQGTPHAVTKPSMIERLAREWETTNASLTELAQTEDKLIALGQPLPVKLDEDVSTLLEAQSDILCDLLKVRATTLQDACTKLDIWWSHAFAGKVSADQLSPDEKLIFQTIRELHEITRAAAT